MNKRITKKMVINALKKDIVLLERNLKLTQQYIKNGYGQFLNVGNDEWCGGYKEVLRLQKDMISFAKKAVRRLVNRRDNEGMSCFSFVIDLWESRPGDHAYESWVFFSGEVLGSDESGVPHHNMLPNYNSLFKLRD